MVVSGLPDDSWWVDDPIDEPGEDLFGRGPFVSRAVALLDQIGSRPSSTVVGLVGPWGSGKTSTIRMIVAGLNPDRWGVTWINPWALSGPDAVVTELLGAMRAAVPEKTSAGARVRQQLSRYGALATPALSMVPVVGSAATAMANEAIQRLTDQGTTLGEQAEQVRNALHALARPTLVVIDDVDRLQPDQLLAVFRAVRVLGRLPHVHYVLAYDQETILDVLSTTPIADKHGARAVAFLEKIVTLRLEQPPVRLEHAESLFNTGCAGALSRASASLSEDAQRRMVEEREAAAASLDRAAQRGPATHPGRHLPATGRRCRGRRRRLHHPDVSANHLSAPVPGHRHAPQRPRRHHRPRRPPRRIRRGGAGPT
ncbi:P-loop NTPase fold protein [Micromonospora sp. NPDC005707]|uniref:KAP family P-loop NTPase fold protein n=1 Tax=Micromonospora sp. NPDC005707 TaxID=3157050 RepID=UPI0033FAAC45